jgi:hypothetical protein
VENLDDAVAGRIEARVLPRTVTQTVGQVTKSVARAVIAADPSGAQERHEEALQQRRVVITPVADGMSSLWAVLPAEGAALVGCVRDCLTAVKARARNAAVISGAPTRWWTCSPGAVRPQAAAAAGAASGDPGHGAAIHPGGSGGRPGRAGTPTAKPTRATWPRYAAGAR